MYVAVGQFAVTPDWQANAIKCVNLMMQARQKGASLLVLPRRCWRDDNDPDLSVKSAQPLDGEFLQQLLAQSVGNTMTTILTIHVPSTPGRAVNTLVAIRDGAISHATPSFIFMMRSAFRSHGALTRRPCSAAA
jgi:predicted amidohydrolase